MEQQFSNRSQRSLDAQIDTEHGIARMEGKVKYRARKVGELEAEKKASVKNAAKGRSGHPWFTRLCDELRGEQLALEAEQAHLAELKQQLADLVEVTPEELKARRGPQNEIAALLAERLKTDAEAQAVLQTFRALLSERAKTTAQIAGRAAAIDLACDDFDAARVEAIAAALPESIAPHSEAWAAWFTGKPSGGEYVVREECLILPETLAHNGVYKFGERVTLSRRQAAELLREDRPHPKRDLNYEPWLSAPPSVVTVEVWESAEAEARDKGIPIEQIFFWRDMEREARDKATGRSPQPADTMLGRRVDLPTQFPVKVRMTGNVSCGPANGELGEFGDEVARDLVRHGNAARPDGSAISVPVVPPVEHRCSACAAEFRSADELRQHESNPPANATHGPLVRSF